jgi:hypothetical protein
LRDSDILAKKDTGNTHRKCPNNQREEQEIRPAKEGKRTKKTKGVERKESAAGTLISFWTFGVKMDHAS